jgi:hypothetical protein
MLSTLLLAACGDSATDPLADFEPQINSATDNFQLQASEDPAVSASGRSASRAR